MVAKKPPKCCHPNCEQCPYKDCRYSLLEPSDYTETNNRDYFLHYDSTGRKLHQPADKSYKNARCVAVRRNDEKRKEYMHRYYVSHREELIEKAHERYDTAKNTEQGRKWRKANSRHKKSYDRKRYLENREEIKARARERYYKKKMEVEDGEI